MKKLAVAACAAVVTAAAGALLVRGSAAPLRVRAAEPTRAPLGILSSGGPVLVRVNPRTLDPLPGPRPQLGGNGTAWSFSPDRSRLALGAGENPSLLLVDTRRMRRVRWIDLGIRTRAAVFATAWVGSRLLAAVGEYQTTPNATWCCVGQRLVSVDPRRGRVVSASHVAGFLEGVGGVPGRLVLLLAPARGMGPARLGVVDAAAHVRLVTLRRILAGTRLGERIGHSREPGLAVDPRGRAFVVGTDELVAEVDLQTLRVAYHTVRHRRSLAARVRDWLQPTAQAKTPLAGSTRRALWLGTGRLAIFGWESTVRLSGNWGAGRGRYSYREEGSGLELVDVRTWTGRRVDRSAAEVVKTAGVLVAIPRPPATRMRAYSLDGSSRRELLNDRQILGLQVFGPYVYPMLKERKGVRVAVVDLRTGRVLRARRGNVPYLLTGQAPVLG